MSAPIDLLTDMLADAPLTPDQREVWRNLCAELVLSRVRIQELETRIQLLERLSEGDGSLQAVLSRPDFNREVARMLAFDERYNTTSSVLYFDFDNLEVLRARHGTVLVDAAVRCISDTLMANIRRSDILGRLAPDEFGVLLPRCDNESAWKKAEKVASALYDALTRLWGPNLKPVIDYGAYTFGEKEELASGIKQAAESVTRLIRQ